MNTIRSMAIRVAATFIFCGVSTTYAASTLLYVSNPNVQEDYTKGKITAFDPTVNGMSTPLITINQPSGAWAVAVDSTLRVYSQYFLSAAEFFVYAPNASGNPNPIFIGDVYQRDATGIAVDSKGYVYVTTGTSTGSSYLEAFAPNTTQSYARIPLYADTDSVTVDADDNVIITAWSRYQPDGNPILPSPNNALLVFPPRLEGGVPIRTISGPNTGLGSLVTTNYHTGFKVSYSKLTGRLYAGISGGGTNPSKVLVFDSHANGDVAPLRTISGPSTGLKPYIQGVAGNPVTGEIFVLSVDGYPTYSGVVTAYTQLANGNVAPIKTIYDASSGFYSSMDIAFAPPASLSINAGGTAAGDFVADSNFTGGGAVTWTNTVDTSLLRGNIPPQSVLKSDREGNFAYTLTGLVPYSTHTLTLYFVENYFNAANKRVFSLSANGAVAIANLDVFAEAGAKFKAIQRSITVNANAAGQIVLQSSATLDQGKVGAIVVN